MTSVFSRRGVFGFLLGVLAILSLGAEAMAQSIRFAVVQPGSGRLFEVIEGSGTGGRFVNSPRSIGGVHVDGYTDRAKRGELLRVFLSGSGVAEYAGVRSDNNVLSRRVNHVHLPAWVFVNVPIDPRADNVRAFVKLPHRSEVSRRLPIGTRP